jgi:hypothetical protein
MKKSLIVFSFLSSIFGLSSCSQNSHETEQYFGTQITNGARRGRIIRDTIARQYFYCYITSTITNDSLIPMHIKIGLPKNEWKAMPVNGQTFRIFLQSKILSNDEIKKCLTNVYPRVVCDTIINPGENIEINVGFLTQYSRPFDLNPIPFVLFSKGHKNGLTPVLANNLSAFLPEEHKLNLLLGLDFLNQWGSDTIKRYSIIPCGQISFQN